MGKASSSKKVARAAGASGGRTSRGKAPVLWYASLVVILLAGVALTAFSRQERQDTLSGPASQTQPRANQDHWHVAYGVYVCDKWLDPVTDQKDDFGIHTHADGVIHVHPFVSKVAGKNATFGKFVDQIDAKATPTSFTWPAPGGTVTKKNGERCGETPSEVKVFYDGKVVKEDPKDILMTDRGKLVVAFVPPDVTMETIGDPPTLGNLDNLTDVAPGEGGGGAPVPGEPPASTPPDPTPGGSAPPASAPPGSAPPGSAPPASAPPSSAPPSSAGP